MTFTEYQKLALRTQRKDILEDPDMMILNGVMGLSGEAGEAIDIVKKVVFQDHTLDRVHLARELGDILWYVAITAEGVDMTLEDVARLNIDKLKARYPEGFDSELSRNRKEGDI